MTLVAVDELLWVLSVTELALELSGWMRTVGFCRLVKEVSRQSLCGGVSPWRLIGSAMRWV